jgi:hypothetical protein
MLQECLCQEQRSSIKSVVDWPGNVFLELMQNSITTALKVIESNRFYLLQQAVESAGSLGRSCAKVGAATKELIANGIRAEPLYEATKAATAVSAAAVASTGLTYGAISSAGFTAIGPAAGSYAAAWMSSIAVSNGVGVVAGSTYATLQSAMMVGFLTSPVGLGAMTVGAAAGIGGYLWIRNETAGETLNQTEGNLYLSDECDLDEAHQKHDD